MNRCSAIYSYLLALFLGVIVSFSVPAFAEDKSGDDVSALMKALQEQGQRLADQEKKMAQQEKALEEQKRALLQERLRFEKLQTRVVNVTGRPLPFTAAASTQQQQQPAASNAFSTETPSEVGTARKDVAKEKPPEIAAVISEGGVLTQKGKVVVTPALEYSRSSATSVSISGFSIVPAVNIGLFDVSQVNRDTVTPSIDLRYGITNRFEVEAKVPYVYRKDSTLGRQIGGAATSDTLSSVSGTGIGDVEVAAHYQINKGQNNWPYLIGNMRFKSKTGTSPFDMPVVNGLLTELPTGSGFYGIQPSLTAIYPLDPVVYYSNLGYLHSLSESYTNYGDVQPGDAYSASFGMSLSLNDKSSVSLGYSHTMVQKTYVNDAPLSNSDILQVGAMDLGYSYNLSDRTNLNFTVSAGVTSDAPDVRLIFRVPMTFDLR